MAIVIKDKSDFKRLLKMSDDEIQEYRDNIYNNSDLFTFDKTGDMLIKELEKN